MLVADWPPLGKELRIWLTVCVSHFGSEDPNASNPGQCLLITFCILFSIYFIDLFIITISIFIFDRFIILGGWGREVS